jgi:hypothetical protein
MSVSWGAHAPRVLVLAPSPKRTFSFARVEKFMPARALAPAREARALPGTLSTRHLSLPHE